VEATSNLKLDHVTLRRVRDIVQTCSDKLYANENIPLEDIKIISVVIEEFVDRYHHGKEEKAYFPQTEEKDDFSEDVRKFLIEHELGRRIAKMLVSHLMQWQAGKESREPVARFLKSYAVFITDHTGKEDRFFDTVEEKQSLSTNENQMLLKHYEQCKNYVGGQERIEELLRLIEYLEACDWMR
jgi:hemerythrin-like domain-containing protein